VVQPGRHLAAAALGLCCARGERLYVINTLSFYKYSAFFIINTMPLRAGVALLELWPARAFLSYLFMPRKACPDAPVPSLSRLWLTITKFYTFLEEMSVY